LTDEVKAFIGKLGLWIRKLEGKIWTCFLVQENNMETSDGGIDQCVKNHMVNMQSRFPKYFSEAISDKCK
jgi:hypothetical protein